MSRILQVLHDDGDVEVGVLVHGELIAKGSGTTIQEAEKAASTAALMAMRAKEEGK